MFAKLCITHISQNWSTKIMIEFLHVDHFYKSNKHLLIKFQTVPLLFLIKKKNSKLIWFIWFLHRTLNVFTFSYTYIVENVLFCCQKIFKKIILKEILSDLYVLSSVCWIFWLYSIKEKEGMEKSKQIEK